MTTRRRIFDVRGQRASGFLAGNGPAVIVCPGLGLTGRFYEHSFAAFANAGLRLIVPDLPGWGRTRGPATGMQPAETAAFLLDFADALEIRRAVWIGHSVGCQTVLELAARRPDRAAGVALFGPTGAPGHTRLRQARGLLLEAFRVPLPVLGAVARDYVRNSLIRYLGTWLRYGDHDLLPLLPAIRCPTLIVAGDDDAVCTPGFLHILEHRIPDASVVRVPGGTHALPRARDGEFERIGITFAQRCWGFQ